MNASNHSRLDGSNTKQERGALTIGTHDYRSLDKTNIEKGGGRHIAPEDLNAEHKVFPRYIYEIMDEKECPE